MNQTGSRGAAGQDDQSGLRRSVFRPPELLRRMVSEGKLGKKTGQGFYDWPKDGGDRSSVPLS